MKRDFEQRIVELSVAQYAKLHGLSPDQVRRRCENGVVDAYRIGCEGGKGAHWRIKVTDGESIGVDEYYRIRDENAALKAVINNISSILKSYEN